MFPRMAPIGRVAQRVNNPLSQQPTTTFTLTHYQSQHHNISTRPMFITQQTQPYNIHQQFLHTTTHRTPHQHQLLHTHNQNSSNFPSSTTTSVTSISTTTTTTTLNAIPSTPQYIQARGLKSSRLRKQANNMISRTARKLRAMGFRGLDSSKYFDPYKVDPRDAEIGLTAAQRIAERARQLEEKRLEEVYRVLKQKELLTRDPRYKEKEQKEPLSQRFLKAQQRFVARLDMPKPPKPSRDELSFVGVLWHYYRWQSLVGFVTAFGSLYFIPPIRKAVDEFLEFNSRRRRGVLGLDMYCNDESLDKELIFGQTSDFSFDVRFLQKKILRDIWAVERYSEKILEIIRRRKEVNAEIIQIMERCDGMLNRGAQMNDLQQQLALAYPQFMEGWQREEKQLDELRVALEEKWPEPLQNIKTQIDTRLDGLVARYLIANTEKKRRLKDLQSRAEGLASWHAAAKNEYKNLSDQGYKLETLLRDARRADIDIEEESKQAVHRALQKLNTQKFLDGDFNADDIDYGSLDDIKGEASRISGYVDSAYSRQLSATAKNQVPTTLPSQQLTPRTNTTTQQTQKQQTKSLFNKKSAQIDEDDDEY